MPWCRCSRQTNIAANPRNCGPALQRCTSACCWYALPWPCPAQACRPPYTANGERSVGTGHDVEQDVPLAPGGQATIGALQAPWASWKNGALAAGVPESASKRFSKTPGLGTTAQIFVHVDTPAAFATCRHQSSSTDHLYQRLRYWYGDRPYQRYRKAARCSLVRWRSAHRQSSKPTQRLQRRTTFSYRSSSWLASLSVVDWAPDQCSEDISTCKRLLRNADTGFP